MLKKSLRNTGSAPIYRETELLLLDCLEMVERTPNSVGIRQISVHLIDNLVDALTTIGLALNESSPSTKLELIDAFYLQIQTVKTCIDSIKEWSNRSRNIRIISNKQMPKYADALEKISKHIFRWRNSVKASSNPS
jgi:hypothetical protein